MIVPALVAASQAIASQPNQPEIVITASRIAEEQSESAASVEIVDRERLQRLGEPLAVSALRLTPSASVEAGGPAGTLAQVRIRGAEANHTLFFIDGIRANDPAAGDIPRFELLNADIASRIEVVRGPQSALWGSDAIGGVVAVNGVEASSSGYAGSIEAGSFGFRRGSTSGSIADQGLNIAAAAGWQSANGIDSFDGTGDRDGYRNLSGRVRASWEVAPRVELGSAAFSLSGRSEFDGFDPLTFVHSDTLDSTRNRLSAGRLWLSGGNPDRGFSGTLSTSLLGSSNRNFLDQ
ncbi:MAG TPA: TonB-dependent receptor plug domain-containing protein, partial [Sphingomicrobium sp.]|nr:TonB-dependent receptor plug domain-containing protein [Sphingomicrobium sp.]